MEPSAQAGYPRQNSEPVTYPDGMVCPEFHTLGINTERKRSGSTAYTDRLQCDNCSHKLSVPRDDVKFLNPEECPHANVNQAKSVKGVARWFCMDCGTVVDQKPRALHTADRNLARRLDG